jgi:hypothetical protein
LGSPEDAEKLFTGGFSRTAAIHFEAHEHQEKLYKIMEQYDGDAFNILSWNDDQQQINAVGRALYHQLRDTGRPFRFIESRLRDVSEAMDSLQKPVSTTPLGFGSADSFLGGILAFCARCLCARFRAPALAPA